MLFFEWSGGGKLYKKKKEKEPIDSLRSRDYDLHITLDQLYQFINESSLGVFSILDIWVKIRVKKIRVKKIHEI